MKLYYCEYCGNLLEAIEDAGNVPSCCGVEMQELIPASDDSADVEKHVPTIRFKTLMCADKTFTKVMVYVGEQPHPSTQSHYIKWIELETNKGRMIKFLTPEDKPCAKFYMDCNEKVTAVYAYCNIHGLWKTNVG